MVEGGDGLRQQRRGAGPALEHFRAVGFGPPMGADGLACQVDHGSDALEGPGVDRARRGVPGDGVRARLGTGPDQPANVPSPLLQGGDERGADQPARTTDDDITTRHENLPGWLLLPDDSY